MTGRRTTQHLKHEAPSAEQERADAAARRETVLLLADWALKSPNSTDVFLELVEALALQVELDEIIDDIPGDRGDLLKRVASWRDIHETSVME